MFLVTTHTLRPLTRREHGFRAPLVVYRRPESSGTRMMIFLHGLSGSRAKTWGSYPTYLFEDCRDLDVALYDYRSGFRGLLPCSAAEITKHAKVLADEIRDSHYRRVMIAGHSLGGLFGKALVADLIATDARRGDGVAVVECIAGLLLLATPQAGSLRVSRLAAALTRDGRTLVARGDVVADLAETFSTRVVTMERGAAGPGKVRIPLYGVVGIRDFWVDRLSASLGIPREQTKYVDTTHTKIVKPVDRYDGAYRWALDKVQRCLDRPAALSFAADAGREPAASYRAPYRGPLFRLNLTRSDGSRFEGDADTSAGAELLADTAIRWSSQMGDGRST